MPWGTFTRQRLSPSNRYSLGKVIYAKLKRQFGLALSVIRRQEQEQLKRTTCRGSCLSDVLFDGAPLVNGDSAKFIETA